MADEQTVDPDLQILRLNKESGFNYRKRREEDWRENYTLYRDKVTINRLTQRQSVNIPLMKQTIRTLLKDVDDMPVLYFENLDNNKQAEVFQNEYWKWTVEQNKMDLKDIVDKRQVFLFGRSFDQMQIVDGSIKITIQDPQDILVDRYMDPVDIDSSRFLIHQHIFVPMSYLEKNEIYDKKAIANLKMWYGTDAGLIKAADNIGMSEEKNKKMSDLGVPDVDFPNLGETIVELSMHFIYRQEEGDDEEQLYMYVEAEDMQILMKRRLEEVIGETEDHYWRNHYAYNTWADDLDRQDFWTDGVADIVRTPNKVLNSWFSQLVENRTLRNFGMHYYDSALEGFAPQTFNPVPWGWYPVPGKPQDVLQKVDIPDLSESLDEMTYIVGLIEKATGATATQQGTQTERQVTLGEVELALGEAKERIKGMSKFYTPTWKDRGKKFLKLIEAAPEKLDAVKIYKKGRNSNDIYLREIAPKDWMTQTGYTTRVWSQDEKDAKDASGIEKANAIKANMPDNPVVDMVYKRKLLEFGNFTPDEVNEAMKFEEEQRKAQIAAEQAAQQAQGMALGAPQLGTPAMPQPPQIPATPQPQKKNSKANKNVVNKLQSIRSQVAAA